MNFRVLPLFNTVRTELVEQDVPESWVGLRRGGSEEEREILTDLGSVSGDLERAVLLTNRVVNKKLPIERLESDRLTDFSPLLASSAISSSEMMQRLIFPDIRERGSKAAK